jgi:hypothetical protein
MLPAEKNERWAWRIGIALLIAVVLYIVIWVVRFAGRSLHRIHDAYNEDVRAPIVELI